MCSTEILQKLLKMETIEIKRQVAKFNKVLADPRNKNLCRKERDYLVEKLEKTQSQGQGHLASPLELRRANRSSQEALELDSTGSSSGITGS
mgnify:CR=1 FL=1